MDKELLTLQIADAKATLASVMAKKALADKQNEKMLADLNNRISHMEAALVAPDAE